MACAISIHDLASTKVRPATILAVHKDDLIILGIFSKLPADGLQNTWVLIEENQPDFQQTGLKKTSVLKTERIVSVHESIAQRQLGTVSPRLLAQVQAALKEALNLP